MQAETIQPPRARLRRRAFIESSATVAGLQQGSLRGVRKRLWEEAVAEGQILPLSTLHAERDAHAAADAQGRQALLRVAAAHLVEEGGEHPGAARSDRVADGDRAAVDVDLGGIPAKLLA